MKPPIEVDAPLWAVVDCSGGLKKARQAFASCAGLEATSSAREASLIPDSILPTPEEAMGKAGSTCLHRSARRMLLYIHPFIQRPLNALDLKAPFIRRLRTLQRQRQASLLLRAVLAMQGMSTALLRRFSWCRMVSPARMRRAKAPEGLLSWLQAARGSEARGSQHRAGLSGDPLRDQWGGFAKALICPIAPHPAGSRYASPQQKTGVKLLEKRGRATPCLVIGQGHRL